MAKKPKFESIHYPVDEDRVKARLLRDVLIAQVKAFKQFVQVAQFDPEKNRGRISVSELEGSPEVLIHYFEEKGLITNQGHGSFSLTEKGMEYLETTPDDDVVKRKVTKRGN